MHNTAVSARRNVTFPKHMYLLWAFNILAILMKEARVVC